jgi:hypothetical protein
MKKILNTYDPVIYPRKLWVANYAEGLDKKFVFCNIEDFNIVNEDTYKSLVEEFYEEYTAAVTIPVHYKATGEAGVLVVIFNPDKIGQDVHITGGNLEDAINTIAHEATHVTDYMYDSLGLSAECFHRNENYAYLLGWAAGSISSSLIKFKEEND